MRKLRLLATPLDLDAQASMVEELRFIKRHKQVFETLWAFDGKCEYPLSLEGTTLSDMGVVAVHVSSRPSHSAFLVESEVTRYEHHDFNDVLLGADFVNYFAGIRDHYARGHDFGPTDEWVVFMVVGSTKVRLRARGSVAALQSSYMDACTRLIARDAGVQNLPGRVVFMCRAAAYEELRVNVQSQLDD